MENHAGGIAMIAFIVAVAISAGYYQFVYIPQANAKPVLPEEILEPIRTTNVNIVEGAVLETNPNNFVPKFVRATLGESNRVVWTNQDTAPHTVTTDEPAYIDQINGKFDSLAQEEAVPGGFLLPGKSFEFTFTKPGEYPYHCEPHPWMQGRVDVTESFS